MKKSKRRFVAHVEQMEGRLLMSAAPQFTIKDLGIVISNSRSLVDGSGGSVCGLNNSGQVVSTSISGQAVLSGPDGGTFSPIGGVGETHGLAVNDSGQVAGYQVNSIPRYNWQAFISSNGSLNYYDTDTVAYGLNNLGDAVGRNVTKALLFHDGTSINLGTLGGDSSEARAINDSNEIAGMAYTAQLGGHAFYYNGSMHDLGTLGGLYSFGDGINSSGQVAGGSTISDGSYHAFLSDPHGGPLHDLGTIPGFPMSEAYDVNDSGESVGTSWSGHISLTDVVNHAFANINGTMYDLNSLVPSNSGFVLNFAASVNNNGQIAVEATDSSGTTHALLLTPVPPAPVAPTIIWSNPADIVYGTPITSTQLNATADVPGTFTYNVAQGTVLHAGAAQSLVATFTPTDTNLYTAATATASINVLPAPLTVTANNATRIYGQPTPPLTGTITGLVNGDTDVATYSTTATTYSPTGTYPITPSLVDSNYNITFVNGTLTQSPVRLFVESYYLARYPNVATMVARGMYSSAFQYFRTIGVYAGDIATPDWTPAIEQTYLTANPDVARSVLSGTLRSGYEHFFLYGQYQNRAGAPPLT